jgi:3-deoxy-D-manno-octulosonate 8-phosphate phosphatase (KDO 8-P phosphatase)
VTKLEALKLLVLDVDGVLTDGTFYLGGHGDTEIKAFHARDGAGIALWRDAGYHVTFLTGRSGLAVERRARELRVPRYWEGIADKVSAFDEILKHFEVTSDQVAVMGDDILDLGILKQAGLSACPCDAARDVLERADLVMPSAGGHGAVRDLVEHILRERGEWDSLVEQLC